MTRHRLDQQFRHHLIAKRVAQAAAPKPRLDQRRATTEHESADPNYSAGFGGGSSNASERDPSVATAPIVADQVIGRNEPCPCGSGKKFKQCHGKLA